MMNLLVDYVGEVKLRIVVRDVEKMFSKRDSIVKSMDDPFEASFPGLAVQTYQALRRETMPLISVANDLLRQSVDSYNRLTTDPDLDIFEMGLSKYFVGEGMFSLRRSRSISLAQAQLVKQLLDVWNDRLIESRPLAEYIRSKTGVSVSGVDFVRPVIRPKRSTKRRVVRH